MTHTEELPQRTPGVAGNRVRMIASIYALAEFFREHPDVPVPYTVTAYCTADSAEEVERLADWFGVKAYGDDHRQAELFDRNGATVLVTERCPDRPL